MLFSVSDEAIMSPVSPFAQSEGLESVTSQSEPVSSESIVLPEQAVQIISRDKLLTSCVCVTGKSNSSAQEQDKQSRCILQAFSIYGLDSPHPRLNWINQCAYSSACCSLNSTLAKISKAVFFQGRPS